MIKASNHGLCSTLSHILSFNYGNYRSDGILDVVIGFHASIPHSASRPVFINFISELRADEIVTDQIVQQQ